MTPQQLAASTGASLDRAIIFQPIIDQAAPDFDITTTARMSAFLAEVGHESGGLHWLTELWGPTSEQETYERDFAQPWGPQLKRGDRNFKAYALGNDCKGDGLTYRGRGLLQVTGKANYQDVSNHLATDFVSNPSWLAQPEYAVRSAMWFWQSHGLNARADLGQFTQITSIINGGQNGAAERLALYQQAKQVLA